MPLVFRGQPGTPASARNLAGTDGSDGAGSYDPMAEMIWNAFNGAFDKPASGSGDDSIWSYTPPPLYIPTPDPYVPTYDTITYESSEPSPWRVIRFILVFVLAILGFVGWLVKRSAKQEADAAAAAAAAAAASSDQSTAVAPAPYVAVATTPKKPTLAEPPRAV